jgi:hypothetical protein
MSEKMTLPHDLLAINQEHIEQFIVDHAREGPHLDFKRDFPTTWNEPTKHEFLADITALANSGGGDLIYGVEEDGQGQAQSVIPQPISNVDQEIRRLQDFLLNQVEPRLPGVKFQAVPVFVDGASGHVLVVRTPQSWAGPHRVKTNQHFFIRDGLRKRQLDVPEIRSLFLRTADQAQRVSDFRTERLGKILSGNAPQRLVDGPVLVVHIVPTSAALGLVQIDPVPYTRERGLPLIGAEGGSVRLNIDGAIAVRNENQQGQSHGYSQFFRNGFFESTYVLASRLQEGKVVLPSRAYEENLIRLLGSFRGELQRLGIDYECAVMLSLIRADEVRFGVARDWGYDDPYQTLFDRKTIVLPDIVARADAMPDKALKPAFDLMWQAAGFPCSRNYNTAGDWAPGQ